MFRKTENGLWKVSFSPAVHTEKKQIHKQLFQLMHLIIYLKMNIVVIHIHISCNMSIGVAKYAHMHEQNVVILLIITSAFNIKCLCLYLQTNKKTQNDHGNKSGYWKLQPESCLNCHCQILTLYWNKTFGIITTFTVKLLSILLKQVVYSTSDFCIKFSYMTKSYAYSKRTNNIQVQYYKITGLFYSTAVWSYFQKSI